MSIFKNEEEEDRKHRSLREDPTKFLTEASSSAETEPLDDDEEDGYADAGKEHNDSNDGIEEEEGQIQLLLFRLNSDELETAASSVYEYRQTKQNVAPSPSSLTTTVETSTDPSVTSMSVECSRMRYAKVFAKRYIHSRKGNAMKKMKATIQFRQNKRIDDFLSRMHQNSQTCEDDVTTVVDSSPTQTKLAQEHTISIHDIVQRVQKQLESQNMYVQGYDKENRSTFLFIPRRVATEHHKDSIGTIYEALYTMERAVACSKASDKTINAIVDFAGFSASRHAPPLSIGKQFLTTLRDHYAGHVRRIYILNAPTSFYCLWCVLKPFVGTKTKDKIVFLSGGKTTTSELSQYYEPSQLPSWIHPDGVKNREFDVKEYLYQTPFDKAFDE